MLTRGQKKNRIPEFCVIFDYIILSTIWQQFTNYLLLCKQGITHHTRKLEWSDVGVHIRGKFDLIGQEAEL